MLSGALGSPRFLSGVKCATNNVNDCIFIYVFCIFEASYFINLVLIKLF